MLSVIKVNVVAPKYHLKASSACDIFVIKYELKNRPNNILIHKTLL
jgi:hypothetical protein